MPQVDVQYTAKNFRQVKAIPTPKKITELWRGWYKEARRAIPELPQLQETGGALPDKNGHLWKVYETPAVSVNYIKFRLVNNDGHHMHVVIARKADLLKA